MCGGAYSEADWEEYTSWKNSTVRDELNGAFYKSAFSKKEKNIITMTKVENCADRVFILSMQEQQKYLSNKEKACVCANEPKTYSYKQDKEVYWLREKAQYRYEAASIAVYTKDGSIDYYYTTSSSGVRPAMWIRVN